MSRVHHRLRRVHHRLRRALAVAALAPACCPSRHVAPVPEPAPPDPAPRESALPPPRALAMEQIRPLLRPDSRDVAFAPASPAEHVAFAALIGALTTGEDAGAGGADAGRFLARLQPAAQQVGFALERWRVNGDDYLALTELPHRRRGSGAYVFRAGPATPPLVALQAPHVYHDRGTGDIAIRLFFGAEARYWVRALFTNTIHRFQAEPGERRKRDTNPADVSHNAGHLYTTATRAFAERGGAYVYQIHGFADDTNPADAIVHASGAAGRSPVTHAIAARLAGSFPDAQIRRYPDEVKVLGGIHNVQRRALRDHPGAVFVHLELARRFRVRLLGGDPAPAGGGAAGRAAIDAFAGAVLGGLQGGGGDEASGGDGDEASDGDGDGASGGDGDGASGGDGDDTSGEDASGPAPRASAGEEAT